MTEIDKKYKNARIIIFFYLPGNGRQGLDFEFTQFLLFSQRNKLRPWRQKMQLF